MESERNLAFLYILITMQFQKTVLKNGVRLITAPFDTETTTVLVLVETGSKYETDKQMGLSHFLEHMCFKGTTKRPSSLQISSELDAIGAQYNAFTGYEYTGYYAKAHKKHVATLIDVVTDIYQDQLFDQKEIDKEKGVIVEEINMYEDMPQRVVADVLMEAMYGDQPAGRNIAGTIESVRAFNREDFVKYVTKHYVAEATVVVVAGAVPTDVQSQIETAFASIRTSAKDAKVPTQDTQQAPIIKAKKKQSDQTHLILAARTYNEYDPKNYALRVLATVLGKGMSSRLFNKLRDEMGVCYYVRADIDTFTDHGFFNISAGVDTKRVEEVVTVLRDQLYRLRDEAVSDVELEKAKEYICGGMYLGLETSDSIADYFGFQEVFRKSIETPAQVEAKIRAVTKEDIQAIAKEFIKPENFTLALVSPFEDVASLERILAQQK
jgi:predicted Zn-dependent peptidase